MTVRADRLAAQLEAANEEFAAYLEALTPEKWLFAERNSRHAEENARPDQAATIANLRHNCEVVAGRLRSLGDEELDRPGEVSGEPATAESEFKVRQLNHIYAHLESIRGGLT